MGGGGLGFEEGNYFERERRRRVRARGRMGESTHIEHPPERDLAEVVWVSRQRPHPVTDEAVLEGSAEGGKAGAEAAVLLSLNRGRGKSWPTPEAGVGAECVLVYY
jgi:hypothetical protein